MFKSTIHLRFPIFTLLFCIYFYLHRKGEKINPYVRIFVELGANGLIALANHHRVQPATATSLNSQLNKILPPGNDVNGGGSVTDISRPIMANK